MANTSDYSSSKAPETAEHAEERDPVVDSRLLPGGADPKTPSQQGMAGLDREDVPGGAVDSGQTQYRDTGQKEVKER